MDFLVETVHGLGFDIVRMDLSSLSSQTLFISTCLCTLLTITILRYCFYIPLSARFGTHRLKVKPAWQTAGGTDDVKVWKIPDRRTAALVFVNSKSGGQLGGDDMIRWFKKYLHRAQVFDLAVTNPKEVLEEYKGNAPNRVRILCCGGDGTVGWILTACRELEVTFSIGVLPLGTGNDLARSIQWGKGMNAIRKHDVQRYLGELARAKIAMFDQWKVEVHGPKSNSKEALDAADPSPVTASKGNASFSATTKQTKVFSMNNYFSMGVDGDIALNFHNERIRHPERFTSQRMNVIKYAMMGFEGAFEGVPLGPGVHIEAADAPGDAMRDLQVNPHWKGIIVGNVPYYQGGKTFWDPDARARKEQGLKGCSLHDQRLEVMAVSGTLHIGMVHLQIDKAIPLSQSHSVTIDIAEDIAMQVDGEPWRQRGPSKVVITYLGAYPMLRPRRTM